jgi:sugar phosphate isomerase/epimerase
VRASSHANEENTVKFAICNELFEGWAFADVCKTISELGYTGLEIAPFTLAPTVHDITEEQRGEVKTIAGDFGVEIVGLHWLFAKTEGYSFTSSDAAVRKRTSDYLAELALCSYEIGGRLLVLGSPPARKIPPGVDKADAAVHFVEAIGDAMLHVAEYQQRLLLEPLGPAETDFMNTADEAESLRDWIEHPNVGLHLDVKAMSTESTPIPEIIRKHRRQMYHFHANDPNLRGPGMGDVDFKPILKALKDVHYNGWVSVEVFDFKPDPVTIARESIQYMKRVWDSVQ